MSRTEPRTVGRTASPSNGPGIAEPHRIRPWQLVVVVAAAAAVAVADALPVAAHTGQGVAGAWSGLLHPLLGPDHVFAMITVGALAAVTRRALSVPGAFIAAMILGGILGMVGLPLPGAEPAIALSVVALGAALLAGSLTRPELALALVAVAGVVHGHAHGVEAPTAAAPLAYVAGFTVASATLHAAGVGVGQVLIRRPAVRSALGSVVIGAGVAFVAGVV